MNQSNSLSYAGFWEGKNSLDAERNTMYNGYAFNVAFRSGDKAECMLLMDIVEAEY
jgi:hypothetical protein